MAITPSEKATVGGNWKAETIGRTAAGALQRLTNNSRSRKVSASKENRPWDAGVMNSQPSFAAPASPPVRGPVPEGGAPSRHVIVLPGGGGTPVMRTTRRSPLPNGWGSSASQQPCTATRCTLSTLSHWKQYGRRSTGSGRPVPSGSPCWDLLRVATWPAMPL